MATTRDLIKAGEQNNTLRTSGATLLAPTDTQVEESLDSLSTVGTTQLAEQADFAVTEPAPTSDTAAAEGFFEEDVEPFTANLEKQAKGAEKGAVSSLEDFVSGLESRRSFDSFALESEGEAGVPQLERDLLDINDQLRREKHALRRAIEAIQKKGGGLKIGANAEIQNIQRESLSKQADLSIIQMAAQGRFDSAKAIADRKARILFEQEENELEARQFMYQENKELFTKAEQRLFDVQFSDRERQLENERSDFETLQATKLKALQMAQVNEAPTGVLTAIQKAETPEEVLQVGGQYGSVDMLDRALKSEQLAKLRKTPEALAPTSVIDQGGRKLLINTQTGEVIKDFGTTNVDTEELQMVANEQAVHQVYDLRSHKGMNSSVGPVALARVAIGDIFGAKDDFIAGVDNLTKDLTLDNLIKAKEEGATFGALSNAELSLLAESATKINNWRKGERGAGGEIIETSGYDASQKDFMAELDRIAYFRVLDAFKKGSTPENLGLATTPDGKVWFRNGDGSVTEIK